MDAFLRTLAIYLFLFVLFRLVGKRTLAELSTFDFILLLIISEATQNALIGDDHSVVTGMTVILTLVLLDLGMSVLKKKSSTLEKITEGVPLVLVDHGIPLEDRMKKTRISEDDILQTARLNQGLERMDQIKYAVLESSGGISIIPMQSNENEKFDLQVQEALVRLLKNTEQGRA